MQFTSLNTLGFADIPPSQMSAATTFASMVQQMTMGMGVAAGAIALRIAALLRHGSASNPTIPDFSSRLRLGRPDRAGLGPRFSEARRRRRSRRERTSQGAKEPRSQEPEAFHARSPLLNSDS